MTNIVFSGEYHDIVRDARPYGIHSYVFEIVENAALSAFSGDSRRDSVLNFAVNLSFYKAQIELHKLDAKEKSEHIVELKKAINAWENSMAKIRQERDALRSDLSSKQRELGEKTTALADRERRISELESEAARLRRELQEATDGKNSLQQRLDELETKNADLEKSLKDKGKEIEGLQNELRRNVAELDDLRERVAKFEGELSAAQTREDELKRQIEESESEKTELSKKYSDEKEKADKLQYELNESTRKLTAAEKELSDNHEQCRLLEAQRTQAGGEAAQVRQQLELEQNGNKELKSRLLKKEEEIKTLEAKNKAWFGAGLLVGYFSGVSTALQTARAERAELEKRLAKSNATIEKLRTKLARVNDYVDQLGDALERARKTITVMNVGLQELWSENARLKTDFDRSGSVSKKARARYSELKKTLDNLGSNRAKLIQWMGENLGNFGRLKSELKAAESRFKALGIPENQRAFLINSLREQYVKAEGERKTLQSEKDESDWEISSSTILLQENKEIISLLTEFARQSDAKCEDLSEEAESLRDEVNDLGQQIREKDAENERLAEDFSRAQTELQTAQQQLEILKTQTLQAISSAAKQITGTTKAACASGINAFHAMITSYSVVAAETSIDVGGSIFSTYIGRTTATFQELKAMCEQFKDQIGKSDAVFNELIRRASIFPYQSIEATEKNNEILADALGAHMDSDGSWSPGAKGSFVAGLDRLIDSATDDIYAAYPTSKGQITDLFQEYKRALSLRAIALASSAHRTTGMQIFNFVGRSMAVLRNAIATSSSIAEVQSKINYLTQALPTAPIS